MRRGEDSGRERGFIEWKQQTEEGENDMNTRFYNAKILTLADDHKFKITEGELWVKGNTICYIGDGTDTADVC